MSAAATYVDKWRYEHSLIHSRSLLLMTSLQFMSLQWILTNKRTIHMRLAVTTDGNWQQLACMVVGGLSRSHLDWWTICNCFGRTFMSLRSGKVSELDSWSTGSLTSVRQADSCSCGPFVLLVSNAAACLCTLYICLWHGAEWLSSREQLQTMHFLVTVFHDVLDRDLIETICSSPRPQAKCCVIFKVPLDQNLCLDDHYTGCCCLYLCRTPHV